jgi:hypothetical protein
MCVISAGGCSGDESAESDPSTTDPGRRGEGGTGGDGDGGPSSTSDGSTQDPGATHFATTALEWSVPPLGGDQGFYNLQGTFKLAERWVTVDLTGDGLPDIVSPGSNDPKLGATWGTSGSHYWKVFKNTGSQFEAASTTWLTPQDASIRTNGFDAVNTIPGGGSGVHTWNTFDVTGDGRPDLVVTGQYDGTAISAFGTAGARSWRVLANNGVGFDAPITWSIPDGGEGAARGFHQREFDNRDQSADLVEAWTTLDMDGDKRADLVVTGRGVGTGGVAVWGSAGSHFWKVYKNNGAGFEKAATNWPVPEGGLGETRGYWGIDDINAAPGLETWVTADVTGDGRPDLVSTGQAVASLGGAAWGSGGARSWKVFVNTGSGFATTPTTWTIPDTTASADRGFWLYSTAVTNVTGDSWATVDMTGDGRADLVVVATSVNGARTQFGAAGARHWKVYKNSGTGFETTPITWTSPDQGFDPKTGYNGLAYFPGTIDGEKWSTFDINNDKVPDLVVTGLADPADHIAKAWGAAGAHFWKVFPGAR